MKKNGRRSNIVSTDEELLRLPYFDWDKVKYFYYVAKLGSFTEAGKFLHLSQSAISRKVGILERHLKCKLLIRTPKGVNLTRQGKELYALVERTFLSFKEFSYNIGFKKNNHRKRKIRIATTHALASYIFSDLIFEYNESNPHLIFDLIGDDHILDVYLNEIDIAIRPIDSRISDIPNEPSITHEHIVSIEKQLYAGDKYLNKYGEPQTLEELIHHRVIGFDHPEKHPFSDINWILSVGMPSGTLRDPVFTTNSVECMIGAAIQGLGIISSYKEYSIIRGSNLKVILPGVKSQEIKEYFVTPSYLADDEEIVKFKNYLKEALIKLKKTL